LDRSLPHGPDPAQVGLPTPFGMVIGMADIIAHLGFLAANITDIGHDVAPFSKIYILREI
jgi:hypothetical protein